MKNRLNDKGVTLLETLVAMGIMAVALSAAWFMMGGRDASARHKSASRDIASYMKLARTGAIRDGRPWAIEFDPANRRYLIYRDPGANEDWGTGDEALYRTVNLSGQVAFGSGHGKYSDPDADAGNGVTYSAERAVFNPNGTGKAGAVYLQLPGGETYAVVTSSFTGRTKVWKNYHGTWSN